MKQGRLKIFYGPMYSGKSAYMIKDIFNNINSQKLVFKPMRDVRSEKLYTREGLVFNAIAIEDAEEIRSYVKDWVRMVYIDELNFFGGNIVDVVRDLIKDGIDVVVSGLDKDFALEWFDHTRELIKMADVSIKLKAKCTICGETSPYTARFINGKPAPADSPKILSDGSDDEVEYTTLCALHHPFKNIQ